MNKIYNFLLENIKEKHIVDNIFTMKYEMELAEKIMKVNENINDMHCFIFKIINSGSEYTELPIFIQYIYHDKYSPRCEIEKHIICDDNESYLYNNINKTICKKQEFFLNKEEYYNLFDISYNL